MCIKATLTTWLCLVVLALVYMVGVLSNFILGVTTTHISQDLHYGDHACMMRPDAQNQSVECYKIENGTKCEKLTASCHWDYSGLGLEYQILAGPSFALTFTICGVISGILADKLTRKYVLAVCVCVLTTAVGLTAAAVSYWQLAVLRMFIGAGFSGFMPTCTSMITDLFPKSRSGMALGIFNWGMYIGYGLSYVIGNFITTANFGGIGWRASYIVTGLIGTVVILLLSIFVKEPTRTNNSAKKFDSKQETNISRNRIENSVFVIEPTRTTSSAIVSNPKQEESSFERNGIKNNFISLANINTATDSPAEGRENVIDSKLNNNKSTVKILLSPTVIMLCLSACVRHTAGFTWAYNTQLYFNTYYPKYNLGIWITCDSIIGGSLGVIVGGIVSDKLVKKLGLRARLYVLAASQLLATPLAVGVLYLPPPGAFFSLLGAYVFAEMWFGVMFAVLVELVPSWSRATAIGVFLFVMNNVGGNLPVAVTLLRKATDYRTALLIMYPGFYFLSSVLFFITSFTIKS